MGIGEIVNEAIIISSFRKRGTFTLIAGLAVLFATLSVTSLLRKSPTCDETGHHIASGYVFLTKGDFAFSTEVPPLSRYIMALPLLSLDLNLPDDKAFWAREDRSEFSRDFIYGLNREKAGKMVLFARIPMVVIGLLGGIFLFVWTRKHFDLMVAAISALLYFLSPNIIAHSSLATTDITATVFIMCSAMCFWDFFKNPKGKTALVCGILLGLALLSKFTALFLIPVLGLMAAGAVFYRPPALIHDKKAGIVWFLLLMLSAAFIVLWAGYFFEFRPLLEGVLRADQKEQVFTDLAGKIFSGEGAVKENAKRFLYAVPVPLSSFIMGIAGIIKHSSEGSRNFFIGEWSDKGNPMYYVVAFLIKTPIPVLIGFFTGIFTVLAKRKGRDLAVYLISIILLFSIMASRSNLQIGLRYLLPVYPFIFIISALGITSMLRAGYLLRITAAVLIIWMAALHLFIWPDYLGYFNEIIGGPGRGYLYLRDSNIDWGQDLPALKKYMDENNINEVKLAYFGTADPAYFGINHKHLEESDVKVPGRAVYAISVHYLETVEWTRSNKNSGKAGESIFVYDFTNQGIK